MKENKSKSRKRRYRAYHKIMYVYNHIYYKKDYKEHMRASIYIYVCIYIYIYIYIYNTDMYIIYTYIYIYV